MDSGENPEAFYTPRILDPEPVQEDPNPVNEFPIYKPPASFDAGSFYLSVVDKKGNYLKKRDGQNYFPKKDSSRATYPMYTYQIPYCSKDLFVLVISHKPGTRPITVSDHEEKSVEDPAEGPAEDPSKGPQTIPYSDGDPNIEIWKDQMEYENFGFGIYSFRFQIDDGEKKKKYVVKFEIV